MKRILYFAYATLTSIAICSCSNNDDPAKDLEKPQIVDGDIPSPITSYEAKVDIPIPYDIDNGDYHFMARVTDKAGWQQLKAISIKIAD